MKRTAHIVGVLGLIAVATAVGCDDDAPWPDAPASVAPDARHKAYRQLWVEESNPPGPADGGGHAWMVSPRPPEGRNRPLIPVGARARFHLAYEAGPLGIDPGGSLWLEISPYWGWDAPQVADAAGPGFTTFATTAAGVELRAGEPRGRRLPLFVHGRKLSAGERIDIVYGAGEVRARVDSFVERGEAIRFSVDGDGDGSRRRLADPPRIDLRAGPPAQLVALLPASAHPDESPRLTLALLDARGNAGVRFAGDLELDTNPGLEGPARVHFAPQDAGRRTIALRVSEPGVFRVHARIAATDDTPALEATSNPMRVRAGGDRLYWADLHGHSRYSDGTGTPEDYFAFARDVAALDVVSLTDHDHWGVRYLDREPALWRDIRDTVQRFHDPGRFVTLLGYEWTHWLQGHRHVLHFDDDGPLVSAMDRHAATPPALWEALRGLPALTFAHHSAGGSISTNWNFPPDPELEPLTEIVSGQGSSESLDTPLPVRGFIEGNGVRDVLDRGFRLGFVGSGDGHRGHPGLVHHSYPRGGLTGILSPSLDRDSLLRALRARRVFATNGPRIHLDVSLDGAPMGSTIPPSPSPDHVLEVRVSGEAPIARIDIVRSGGVESLPQPGTLDVAIERRLPSLRAGEYLYVRVVQDDDGAAWSSPFFAATDVTPEP